MHLPVPTCVLAALSISAPAPVAGAVADSGTFVIHKLQHPVGVERYHVRAESAGSVLTAETELNYLGSPVRLAATLRLTADGAPVRYAIAGQTSTMTHVDATVDVAGGVARMRLDGRDSVRAVAATPTFTATPYPSVSVVQALTRYWVWQARPAAVALLPGGTARLESLGHDTVAVGGRPVVLERLGVRGLGWGRQSVWIDGAGTLVALAGGDAELDRLEAIRAGYEPLLPHVVRQSVADALADLARVAGQLRPVATGRYAIVGARLVDGTGAPPVEDAAVVVDDGRIVAAGRRVDVRIPDGTPVLDARGGTLLPGLWDTHGHLEQAEWPLALLAAGATTVRDMGNEVELATALRDAVDAGRVVGPRLLLAGTVDGGPHPLGVHTAGSAEEARAVVRRHAAAGARQIKVYGGLPPELVPVVADEAHRLGLSVVGHVPAGMTAREFVAAGADQITHIGYVGALLRTRAADGTTTLLDPTSPEGREALRPLVERGTVVEPTLARSEQHSQPRDSSYAAIEPGVALAPPELRDVLESTGATADVSPRALASLRRLGALVAALHEAGVPILVGSDLAVPGHSLHRELELLVRAGLTPMQAIQAATAVPARVFGLLHESGTVEAGKRADLILVDGDPLARIEDIRRITTVVATGRAYRAADLWRAAGFEPGFEPRCDAECASDDRPTGAAR